LQEAIFLNKVSKLHPWVES